jgi:hypothetical protein
MINKIFFDIEKFQIKKLKLFEKLLRDKSILKIEKKNNTCFIYYENGQIFKCSGFLADNSSIDYFEKQGVKRSLW